MKTLLKTLSFHNYRMIYDLAPSGQDYYDIVSRWEISEQSKNENPQIQTKENTQEKIESNIQNTKNKVEILINNEIPAENYC